MTGAGEGEEGDEEESSGPSSVDATLDDLPQLTEAPTSSSSSPRADTPPTMVVEPIPSTYTSFPPVFRPRRAASGEVARLPPAPESAREDAVVSPPLLEERASPTVVARGIPFVLQKLNRSPSGDVFVPRITWHGARECDGMFMQPKKNLASVTVELTEVIAALRAAKVRQALIVTTISASSDLPPGALPATEKGISLWCVDSTRKVRQPLSPIVVSLVLDNESAEATVLPSDCSPNTFVGANGSSVTLQRIVFSRCTSGNRSGNKRSMLQEHFVVSAAVTATPTTATVPVLDSAYRLPSIIVRQAYPYKARTKRPRTADGLEEEECVDESDGSASRVGSRGPESATSSGDSTPFGWTTAGAAVTTCGKVGIGIARPTEALTVVGNALVTGTIRSLCDERLKRHISATPDGGALATINSLRLYEYEMIPEVGAGTRRQAGLIAQEVERALPTAVTRLPSTVGPAGPDEVLTVDYRQIVATQVGAIRELTSMVHTLDDTVRHLRHRLHVLEQEHDAPVAVASSKLPTQHSSTTQWLVALLLAAVFFFASLSLSLYGHKHANIVV
jgi:hypothetical protein